MILSAVKMGGFLWRGDQQTHAFERQESVTLSVYNLGEDFAGTNAALKGGYGMRYLAFAIVLLTGLGLFNRQADSKEITLLHTNDFHGQYMPFYVEPGCATSQTGDPGGPSYSFERKGMVGGFAYLAAKVNTIRQSKEKGNTLLVHTGDTFSDNLLMNLTKGEAMITMMNRLGYDFMSLGNHDFDYTFERTKELQEMAEFPMRGINVVLSSTGEPVFGEPYKIFEMNGVKTALVAVGYRNTAKTTDPKNVEELAFQDAINQLQKIISELKSQADIVVLVSHQGKEVDELTAEKIGDIDLIIGGHSHDKTIKRINNTWIVQALADAACLGEMVLEILNGKVIDVNYTLHTLWNDEIKPDPEIERLIEELRAPHKNTLEEVIGEALEPICRNYMAESPFDKMVGDYMVDSTGADIALLTGVGYGITIYPGEIQREQLYNLIPHSSKLVTLKLTGNQIVNVLEQSAKNVQPDDPAETVGGLVQTTNMSWTIDFNKEQFHRISDVKVKGKSIQEDKSYSVATHSGILAGAHRYDVVSEGKDITKIDLQINELVERKFKEEGKVKAPKPSQVTIIKKR
jgi:5'-nucleotidase / UDP-sugar diphosphatase